MWLCACSEPLLLLQNYNSTNDPAYLVRVCVVSPRPCVTVSTRRPPSGSFSAPPSPTPCCLVTVRLFFNVSLSRGADLTATAGFLLLIFTANQLRKIYRSHEVAAPSRSLRERP